MKCVGINKWYYWEIEYKFDINCKVGFCLQQYLRHGVIVGYPIPAGRPTTLTALWTNYTTWSSPAWRRTRRLSIPGTWKVEGYLDHLPIDYLPARTRYSRSSWMNTYLCVLDQVNCTPRRKFNLQRDAFLPSFHDFGKAVYYLIDACYDQTVGKGTYQVVKFH